MKFYLYSSQDLNLSTPTHISISAGNFYMLELEDCERIIIYPKFCSGVMIIDRETLLNQCHNQIEFYKLSNDSILCEIKPFRQNLNIMQYNIKGSNIRLAESVEGIYIIYNNQYYGKIEDSKQNISFNKVKRDNKEVGIIYFDGDNKNILVFDNSDILFCGRYVDSEILKECIKIYSHLPNIFNCGQLLNYNFKTGARDIKTVQDRGEQRKLMHKEFAIIYFLEAIKCKRYNYAYNMLSYELKAEINVDILSQYFSNFDRYEYICEQDTYITLKNQKIVGIYHFVEKEGIINNIY